MKTELVPSYVSQDRCINIYDTYISAGKKYGISFNIDKPLDIVAILSIIGYRNTGGISETEEICKNINISSGIFNYETMIDIPKGDIVLFRKLRITSSSDIGISKIILEGRAISKVTGIDIIVDKHRRDISIDTKNRILYIYPIKDNANSFHIVASNHIKSLTQMMKENNGELDINEIDWNDIQNVYWDERKNILIHPILYPFGMIQSLEKNIDTFARLIATKNKIGGFDVADSNRISDLAVEILNRMDLVMVPSNFSKDVYMNSGVEIPVEILSHGLTDEFLIDNIDVYTSNEDINNLRKLKSEGKILVLFFLLHSGYRKCADLVIEVMKKIQSKFNNVILVLKGEDQEFNFSEVRTIQIKSWIDDRELRSLYDTCDICLVVSRGGGLELNALEAISRGLPTLVSNGGCFLDMIDYYIPINITNKLVHPLPGNTIHTGFGCEVDIDDFERKLEDTILNLENYKKIFEDRSKDVRNIYSWENTAKRLHELLVKYEFCHI